MTVTRITSVEAVSGAWDWRWARENREAIEKNWAEKLTLMPRLFNGRVLLMTELKIEGDRCKARFFETDFKDFLAWRDLGTPDPTVFNAYAMGALQGSDGAFICGAMGEHTANAGRIYFPSGTPDLSDLRPDGSVDLAGSVIRELEEETGLAPEFFDTGEDWLVVQGGPAVAFMRMIHCREPAREIAVRIAANIATQEDPELSGVRVISDKTAIDAVLMPRTVQVFLAWYYDSA